MQAGSIGMWRAIRGYDLSSGNKFLTYAKPAIKRAMSDLIRQYSQDAVWRMKQDKANTWKIVYLDETLNDTGEDTIESLIASPHTKPPEQIYIAQETETELRNAMDALPDRENVYVQYRFGFTDGEAHPLTETAQYFRLTESRAKGVERSTLKRLRHELFIEIPERAFAKVEDRLTKLLFEEGELHTVELRLKSQRKRGKKYPPQSTNISRTATASGANSVTISKMIRRRFFCWLSGIQRSAIGSPCGLLVIFGNSESQNCQRNLY